MGKDLSDESRHELNMIFSFEPMETGQFFVKWFKRKFHAGRFGEAVAKWQKALNGMQSILRITTSPATFPALGMTAHTGRNRLGVRNDVL